MLGGLRQVRAHRRLRTKERRAHACLRRYLCVHRTTDDQCMGVAAKERVVFVVG